jgi:hypothetical protein
MPKGSLAAAMRRSAQTGQTNTPAPAPAAVKNAGRPDRDGKSNVTGYYSNAVKKQLRQMCVDRDMTIQALLAEALNCLFEKYGKPAIATAE